jgi:cytoskeletal protein RodZ
MTRTNQGGSVASFVLIGGALVLVTVGVLFWARHPQIASVAMPGAMPEIAVAPTQTNEPEKKPEPTPAPKESTKTPTPSPSTTPPPTPTPNPAPKSTPTPVTTPAPTEISHTGPLEMMFIWQLLAAGLLAGSVVALISSYRQRSSL